MATKINVGINVSSNGTTDQETKKVKGLKDMLDGAEASARRTSKALSQATATPSGTRSGARAQEASMTSAQLVEYNRGRSVAGGTGAGARDFSNQAQGLGGLVRIYATLAANIFAATAAFGALSRALDTTNMIRGLDQLGAASGTALGSLSQRLVTATDGAVSLREAMEATVKASSAGLNSDQILKMGQVAKQASLALGVNMTDALSRISRGVTKLEPELLDELGLFVKIDDAAGRYALSIGKSASQLTDFERRQAFANEVLDQGIKKFGEIDLQSNSYSRLAAQLSNLTQSGLELVNKFLTPVANILADNTALLVGVLGILGAKILKMAIPALGEWRAGLVSAAKTAKESAAEINTSFAEYTVEGWEQKLGIPGLKQSVKTAEDELKALASARPSTIADKVSKTDLSDQKQLSTLLRSRTASLADHKKKLDALGDSNTKQARAEKKSHRDAIDYLNKEIAKTKELIATRKGLEVGLGQIAQQDVISPGTAGEWSRGKVATEANRTARSLEALSRVSENTLRKGIVDSIKTLNQELGKNVGVIRRWSTLAAGSLVAVGTSAGIMFNAISGYVTGFLMLGGAVVGLIKYFSTSRREAELAGEAFDRVEAAVKNSITVVERLQKLGDPLENLSIQSIDARATAMKELGDSINLSVVRGFAQLEKMNAGDRFINWVSQLWGGDVKSKMAEGLSDGIKQSFELIDNTDIAEEVRVKLESIVGASYGTANFNTALEELVKGDNKEKIKELAKTLETLGNAAKVSSSKAVELVESFKQVDTTIQEFQRSLQPNDTLYKIATQSTDALIKLDRALQDPTTSLAALREASKNVNFLSMIPPESADRIIANTQALEDYSLRAAQAQNAIKPLRDEINKISESINNENKAIRELEENNAPQAGINARKNLVAKLEKDIERLKQKEIELKVGIKSPDLEKLRNEISSAIGPALEIQARKAAARLAQELTTAQQYVTKTIAALLGGTEAGIKLQATLERQALDAQGQLITETRNLALEIAKNTATREQETLKNRKIEIEAMGEFVTPEVVAEYQGINKSLQKVAETLKGIDQLRTSKGLVNAPGNLASTNPALYGLSQQTSASNVALKGIENQKAASYLKEQFDLAKKTTEENNKSEQSKLSQLKSQMQLLEATAGTSQFASEELKTAKENLRTKIQTQEGQLALSELTATETALRRVGEELNKRDLSITLQQKAAVQEALRADIERVIAQREDLKQRLAVDQVTQNITAYQKRQAEDQKKAQETQRLTELGQQRALELAELDFEMQSALNDELKNRNGLTETAYVLEKQRYDLLKLRAEEETARQTLDKEFEPKKQAAAERVGAADYALEQAAGAGITDLTPFVAAVQAARAEQQALNQEIAASTGHLNAVFEKRKEILAVGQMQALNQAQLNDLTTSQEKALQSVYAATEGLADVFGELGKTIADSLGSWVKNSQDNATARLKIDQDYNTEVERIARDRTTSQEEKDEAYTKAYKKHTSDNLKQDINYFSKNITGAKGMFKEKTVAYKALAAVEKIMHITKLAMWVKETFMDTARTGVAVANSATRGAASVVEAGIDGVKAVVKAIASLPFPLNLAAGAATAAVVAGLLSSIGGKKPGLTAGQQVTAEQRQEVQGSAMDYNDQGELVQVRRGVFGDTGAKSESIANSIEILKENSVEGLNYDNRMLRALEKVANALTGAAGFLSQVRGISTGSLSGVVPGTTSTGGLLGIGGLFDTKITKTIVDSGLEISGTFLELSKVGQGTIKAYEVVNTQVKDSGFFGLFGGSDVYQNTITKDLASLGPEAAKAVEEIANSFSAGIDVLKEVGKAAGVAESEVDRVVSSLPISLKRSLIGLTGEQIAAELNSLLSNSLDLASESLFGYYEKFSKFGEGLLETVVRVSNQTQQAEQQLKNIGINLADDLEDIKGTILIPLGLIGGGALPVNVTLKTVDQQITDLTNSLVELSGGLDKFVANTTVFQQKFLTESERLQPKISTVNSALSQFGLTSEISRDSFKNLVQSINLGTQAGREAFVSLMNVADSFDEIKAAEERLDDSRKSMLTRLMGLVGREKELRMFELEKVDQSLRSLQLVLWAAEDELKLLEKKRSLQLKLLQIEGNINAIREYELSLVDDSLKYMQVRVWALEDEKALIEKLNNTRKNESNAIKSTITNIKQAIASLKDYRSSLLVSDISTLTPVQKYETSKSEFDSLVSTIMRTPVTEEDKKAQLDATNKFQQVSKDFLDLSRTVFASSPQFTTDFDKVVEILDYTADTVLQDQLTNEEKQLIALESSTNFLDSIDKSTETSAEILSKLYGVYIRGLSTSSKDSKFYYSKIFNGVKDLSNTVLTSQQVKIALSGLAEDKTLDSLIKNADTNTDGLIDSVEGSAIAQTLNLLSGLKESANLLEELGSTVLTYTQIKQGLKGLAEDSTIEDLIKSADKNSDGFIDTVEGASLEEILTLEKYFTASTSIIKDNLDEIENLTLTYKQLVSGLEGLATDEVLGELIRDGDTNKDDLIDAIELSNITQRIAIINSLDSGFNNLDLNLDGKLSSEEFNAGLTGRLAGTEASKLYTMLDLDNDQLISKSELIGTNTQNTVGKVDAVATNVAIDAQIQSVVSQTLATMNNSGIATVAYNTGLMVNNMGLLEATNFYLQQIRDSNNKMAQAPAGGGAPASKGGGLTKTEKAALGGLAALGAFLIFSDARTKKNIEYHSTTPSGINLYDFEYKDSKMGTGKKRGVLAQEVLKDYPDAVFKNPQTGILSVDYNELPIAKNLLKFADGGYATGGLAVVGENGPELVDFTSPGRVYTAEETFGMFNGNNEQLVTEIRELRKEVEKLREQQRNETGAIITSNAVAVNNNATVIAKAIEDKHSYQDWRKRQTVGLP